jgi:hypothetical protein
VCVFVEGGSARPPPKPSQSTNHAAKGAPCFLRASAHRNQHAAAAVGRCCHLCRRPRYRRRRPPHPTLSSCRKRRTCVATVAVWVSAGAPPAGCFSAPSPPLICPPSPADRGGPAPLRGPTLGIRGGRPPWPAGEGSFAFCCPSARYPHTLSMGRSPAVDTPPFEQYQKKSRMNSRRCFLTNHSPLPQGGGKL